MRRVVYALILVAALALAPPAQAAVRGSLELHLDAGELPVLNGAVTLYPVGIHSEAGFRMLDKYGGGMLRQEDMSSENLARWLAELASDGRTLLLDVDGRAVFSNLEEGVYLVKQTERMDGFYPFRPFLVALPSGGRWELLEEPGILPIAPEPPRTGQDPETLLAAAAMVLSGTGLILCWIWDRRKKQRDKFRLKGKKAL